MSRTKPARILRALLSAGIVCVIAGGVVGFGVLASEAPAPRTEGPGIQPLPVETLAVRWEDAHTITRSFVGRVEAKQESDLGFEIPGTIETILVDEGETVRAGDPIATLNTDRVRARRVELVASRDRAAADAQLAELRFERTADARARNALSQQAYDDAEKGLQAANAALAAADAAIRSVDTELEKAAIASPFDAVVAARLADTGRVIAQGTPVIRLFERVHPEVRFALTSAAADALEPGRSVEVRIRDRVIAGTVRAVLPTRDAAARGVDVIVTLDAPLNGIRRGDLARLELTRSRRAQGFWVPTQALTEGIRGLWSVYLLEPLEGDEAEGAPEDARRITRVDVEVIHQETDRVFVAGGLEEGDQLVASGLHRVTPGMLVTLGSAGGDR